MNSEELMYPYKERIVHQYTIHEMLELLNSDKSFLIIRGYRVPLSNPRYALFKENLDCVWCGTQGSIAKLQTGSSGRSAWFHVYNTNHVLLNKDHIMPKSKKGPNQHWNYQLMCVYCNGTKRARLPATTRFLHPSEPYTEEEKTLELWLGKQFGYKYSKNKEDH
jgi:hypothetical protein